MEDFTYIADVYTVNTGGHCLVDMIKLKDGRYLCISDETVMLYNNKVKCTTVDGKAAIGYFIRHIDNYTSVVYCGGYESKIVDRKSIVYI